MLCLYCPPALCDILLTSMAQYSLFVLEMPLNTKQTNKQASAKAVVRLADLLCTWRRYALNRLTF